MTVRTAITALSLAALTVTAQVGEAYAQAACQRYTAAQVAEAVRNSPNANQTLRNAACDFGGAAIAESGGRQCASNGNNFGVLQLTRSNLPAGMTPAQYMALPLQQQVNIWAQQTRGNLGTGYTSLSKQIKNNQTKHVFTPKPRKLKS